jgi:2,3-dihydroxybenzoate decarboxylase
MRVQKIAIEEHFGIPDTVDKESNYLPGDGWQELKQSLLDTEGRLLPLMDRYGIEKSVMSLTSGGIQTILSSREAVETAQRANDYIARLVAKRPDRLQAFAALPLQDPEAAAAELTRAVEQLGLVGGLVNGFTQRDRPDNFLYYDLPQFWPFWEQVEKLGVPVYIHPRYLPKGRPSDIEGHPWFTGSAWMFGVNTATHALRLMASGLFDRYPKLSVIIGHLGETIPNTIWRIDHRVKMMPRGITIQKSFSEYLRRNFYVTTSGNFCTTALLNVLLTMGADRVLFAVDYPYEPVADAAEWFDRVDAISEPDWEKIARTNAAKLLRLGHARAAAE